MKAFFIDWDGHHWVEVGRRLAAQGLLRPVCWTAFEPLEGEVRAAFPDALFHDIGRAVRGLPPRQPDRRIVPSSPEALRPRLAEFRAQAMLMMDRMDPDRASFAPEERERFFDELAAYWHSVLQTLEPDIVMFSISPHLIYDYVIYALCRCLDIPTVMFDRTALPERIVLVERLEEGSKALQENYARACSMPDRDAAVLGALAEQWWRRWRGDYDKGMPANFKAKLARISLFGRASSRLRYPRSETTILQQALRLAWAARANNWKAPANYLKQRGKRMQESAVSLFKWGALSAKGVLYKRRLLRRYQALQREPTLDRPFIFVALHYQPERNTSPVGGIFADQLRLVETLSRTAPQGWRIVVKEHGWQLHPQSKGERSRAEDFYDRLAALPNVDLCPLDRSPFDLIDHARAVATVSGSAGWEALCRGKPALVFGAAWYATCDGAYRIRDENECAAAVAAIATGARPDEAKVRLLLSVLDKTAYRAIIEPGLDVSVEIGAEDNVRNLTAALAGHIETELRRHAA